MKRLCLALVCWLAACPSALVADEIKLAGDIWYPYTGVAEDPLRGYLVDVAEQALEGTPYKISYSNLEWSKAVQETRAGRLDCLAGGRATDAPDFPASTIPVGHDQYDYMVLVGDTWDFTGPASLGDRRIGIPGGYSFSSMGEGWFIYDPSRKDQVVSVYDEYPLRKLLQLLVYGRINVFIDNPEAARFAARNLGFEGRIRSAGMFVPGGDIVYICTPAKPDFSKAVTAALDAGIQRLKASGRMADILALYGLDKLP